MKVDRQAKRFDRTGLLALDPKAFLELFIAPDAATENTVIGDATIVDIRGPLTARDDYWSDSYESIVSRIKAACESPCKAIVMRVDSPGGDCQGCFEAVREIRQLCQAAQKPLYAFVDRACSAGYALASAAQWIVFSESATGGSIGVLSTRVDYSQQNLANGVRVVFVASGSHKADGHPDSPVTDAELQAEQQLVDSMAAVFFGLVAEHRQLDIKAIEQLEARVLHGASAVGAGLADEVGTLGSLLARIGAGGMERTAMAMTYEKMRAGLEELAQGDDANAAAAKAALAALDAASGVSATDGDEDKPAEEKPKPDESTADPKPDEEKPAARAPAGDLAAQAWAKVHELETKIAQRDEADERAKLVASRPDFGPELLQVIKSAPLETVRDMVAKLPKGKVTAATAKRAAADQADVKPTQGEGQADGSSHLSPAEKEDLDRRMGLGKQGPHVVNEPYRMTLSGVPQKKTMSSVTPKGANN